MVKNKRDFIDGSIYTITKYIYWFIMGNLYFTILNLPLVFILITILTNGKTPLPQGFNIVVFICCLPIGASITSLFSIMGKLVRERDLNITKDFFTAYKNNFLQATLLWTLELITIVILFIDTKFFISRNYPSILTILFYQIIVFVFMMGLYSFPILTRFNMKSWDIIKLSAYYTIKKINRSFINLAILVVSAIMFFKLSPLILILISSVICFLIMYNERRILFEIDTNLKADTTK